MASPHVARPYPHKRRLPALLCYICAFLLALEGFSESELDRIRAIAVGNSPELMQLEKIADKMSKMAKSAIKPNRNSYRIIRYWELPKEQISLVIVGGGSAQGIVEGAIFNSYRAFSYPVNRGNEILWVKTGSLKAIKLGKNFTLARVTSQGSMLSRSLFPKFFGVMGGDWVYEQKVQFSRNLVFTPTRTLSYHEIFLDPKAYPNTFELSFEGCAAIDRVARDYSKLKLPLLMIEGHTDRNGASEVNQVESYQRALTVRKYLIDTHNFDPARVVAIGYGESEPAVDNYVPDYRRQNRRIVFKVRPMIR